MNRAAGLGLVFGVVIGGAYALLQWLESRRREVSADPPRSAWSLVPGAMARLAFVVVACGCVVSFTEADKYWLTCSLAGAYSVGLAWRLKRTCRRKP
ncbi:MAG: hypothetical protein N3B01_02615 [Verrucomicrobiae bacterium]|nr:hypothetical protein [Verrucomicrobiae bacterium]